MRFFLYAALGVIGLAAHVYWLCDAGTGRAAGRVGEWRDHDWPTAATGRDSSRWRHAGHAAVGGAAARVAQGLR